MLVISLVLASCVVDSNTGDPIPTSVLNEPIATEIVPDATATLAFTPEPTRSAAFEALLAPGPTVPPPDGLFFQWADEIWYLPGTQPARRVVTGQRIGPWAQTVDGQRIALVRYQESNGQGFEEIVLVDSDGNTGEPVYGPVSTTGATGEPAIREMDWSWDGQILSIILSDNSIASMRFATDDPFRTRPPLEPVATSAGGGVPTDIAWAPSGAGIAYLMTGSNGGTLYVTPNGETPRAVIGPQEIPSRAVRAFNWLPGRGRLVFVEEGGGPSSQLPGSIFTITPDGQLLELLISAGQFAPAATIAILRAGTEGRDIAFTVQVPNARGQQMFQSLWILSIDGGELVEVPVQPGYRVVDIDWTASGLIWRGIDRNARVSLDGRAFTGEEPFILCRFDAASGISTILFQSTLAD